MDIKLEKEKLLELQEPDPLFKPNPVHLAIMKQAKRNGGRYNRADEIAKIRQSDNPEKLKAQMLSWNAINLETLVRAGYLKQESLNIYVANPKAYDLQRKEFQPGKNHAKLMRQNTDGVIKVSELNSSSKSLREQNFDRKMLENLNKNAYIERIDRGIYKITEKGQTFLKKMDNTLPCTLNAKAAAASGEFKVTSFDKLMLEVTEDGKISESLLCKHKRADSLRKRIETFKRQQLISEDGILNEKCLMLLDKTLQFSKAEMLTLEKLTPEQLQLIKDIRLFLNLSKKQILEHVYGGNKELAESDLAFLIRKKVIRKEEDFFGIYIMDKRGIELTNELYPDAVKYHTKLHSRKEEVEHDMLVYSAYKAWERELHQKGGRVIEIKNDRQMRSEDAKMYGHMIGSYPDLRIYFQLPGKAELQYHNIEIDCGYDEKTIIKKANGILTYNLVAGEGGNPSTGETTTKSITPDNSAKSTGLSWYCKTLYQATKVINILTKEKEKGSRMNVARKLTVYYLDKDGHLQTVTHRHWDGMER